MTIVQASIRRKADGCIIKELWLQFLQQKIILTSLYFGKLTVVIQHIESVA